MLSHKLKFETLGSGLVCWDPYLQQSWNPIPEKRAANTFIPKNNTYNERKKSLIMMALQILYANTSDSEP